MEDIYPRMSGRRLLKTPGVVKAMFGEDEIRRITTPQADHQRAEAGARMAAQPNAHPGGFPAPGVVPPPQRFNQGEPRIQPVSRLSTRMPPADQLRKQEMMRDVGMSRP